MEGEFKTHLFEYEYGGETWVLEVKAASREDAIARLARHRTYLGEVQAKVSLGWIDRLRTLFQGAKR